MTDSIFEDRDQVAESLGLPSDVSFSVIGETGDGYQSRLFEMIKDLLGPNALREHAIRRSNQGKYEAYRLKIHMKTIDEVEVFYHTAAALEGTRSVM